MFQNKYQKAMAYFAAACLAFVIASIFFKGAMFYVLYGTGIACFFGVIISSNLGKRASNREIDEALAEPTDNVENTDES